MDVSSLLSLAIASIELFHVNHRNSRSCHCLHWFGACHVWYDSWQLAGSVNALGYAFIGIWLLAFNYHVRLTDVFPQNLTLLGTDFWRAFGSWSTERAWNIRDSRCAE